MADTTGYSDICLACLITKRKKTRRVLSKESNKLIFFNCSIDFIVMSLNEGF